ncbi:Fanconi anemia group J protein-like isoform X2 [Danaus plexippus]|uniref:Fanconi anemia group J protein-like isoform X2 n=1 Tax=Danaus plexippus TaxID=13037 RepID=UPI0013C40580|nr:Fanconi anemia group J protein-like isoform X2 [Danaus plexippus]
MSSKRSKNNLENKVDLESSLTSKSEEKKLRQVLISNMFSSKVGESSKCEIKPSTTMSSRKDNLMIKRTILGVEVVLPIEPYRCQMVVMSKVIKAINEGQNCLLESPTGTGKTLALLCSSLAWQKREEERIRKERAKDVYFRNPQLKDIQGAEDFISSARKDVNTCEVTFTRPIHGQKSIYDTPTVDVEDCYVTLSKKRKEILDDSIESDRIVGNEKKLKLDVSEAVVGVVTESHRENQITVTKGVQSKSLPIIYYGARTHKQLEQVVQEFSKTVYAENALMTILSSREHSCIKDFDIKRWPSKNDMCRGCTKNQNSSDSETSCVYYDNHKLLKHSTLPRAFSLETLLSVGRKKKACPYYAARKMAAVAHIVFCPYSYLIEPAIRKSMQINLENNVVIIDEAHNIEDICREAATFTFTKLQMENALKEMKAASSFRFANDEAIDYITYLQTSLEEWCLWFANQKPLLDNQPRNGAASEYAWDVHQFVETLNNHSIGQKQYPEFNKHAGIFCKKFRDDPRLLVGITQSTNTIIENLDTVLGYLFRNSGTCMDDYKPILVRKIESYDASYNHNWRKSNFEQKVLPESLSLTLCCLNPAVLFASVLSSRCVVLASGTLTPMASLHSELGTHFTHAVSATYEISKDRVWVGSLKSGTSGEKICCISKYTSVSNVQDDLGEMVYGVCDVTPHGVLCFLPSYRLMNLLVKRWRYSHLWERLEAKKHVFVESTHMKTHVNMMKAFDNCVGTDRGALLLAVYRGKVAEGMDFKDHQARAVIAIGIPYPSKDRAVEEKMKYNDKYSKNRNLLNGREWLKIQAYRALNQAVGRVMRHVGDWGGVLLVDSRYQEPQYSEHLAQWVKDLLGKNHHDFNSLFKSDAGLRAFMERKKNEE